ncbi:hypothetical protein NDU88_002828 [Pleurodeles waltl]|uniref:Uncharacterized protein n=1 Tax=Pleurodeles waltl TaxID=8319 RepID=A0AAV7UY84_PLEWA|nr:hypothetical protein NDU88_002828 [Pleurodeles waltl]
MKHHAAGQKGNARLSKRPAVDLTAREVDCGPHHRNALLLALCHQGQAQDSSPKPAYKCLGGLKTFRGLIMWHKPNHTRHKPRVGTVDVSVLGCSCIQ